MNRPFAIFPCRGKVPLTEHGCKDATTDQAQIAAWQERYPGCSWAIATRAASGGLLVVDVDGIWESPGDAWTAIANDCGGLPRTVTVLSGSGHSMHWYLLVPGCVLLGEHRRQARTQHRYTMRWRIRGLPAEYPP